MQRLNYIVMMLNTFKENPPAALGVSLATVLASLADSISWLTGNVTTFGLFAGLFLSIVLSISHIKKTRRDEQQAKRNEEKHKLEMEILRKDLEPFK